MQSISLESGVEGFVRPGPRLPSSSDPSAIPEPGQGSSLAKLDVQCAFMNHLAYHFSPVPPAQFSLRLHSWGLDAMNRLVTR